MPGPGLVNLLPSFQATGLKRVTPCFLCIVAGVGVILLQLCQLDQQLQLILTVWYLCNMSQYIIAWAVKCQVPEEPALSSYDANMEIREITLISILINKLSSDEIIVLRAQYLPNMDMIWCVLYSTGWEWMCVWKAVGWLKDFKPMDQLYLYTGL